ncbi:hypothetical protein NX774_09270 [Massilia agilis]|uniref:Uncharacterized protein n=1 Tax=Massilia agilis TaxID=1811226 RepID=A0ABT2D9X9_9BURK|nr:hypothetical protein [Massilia agilis]MCS0808108.1 hypothetical protein [Massilia agilis]
MAKRSKKQPRKKLAGSKESDLFATTKTPEETTETIVFAGTENPRYLRALHALLTRPMPRKSVDSTAGCSNGPDLISALRALGLGEPGLRCAMVPDTDRDGRAVRRGVYYLTGPGRRAVNAWLRLRAQDSSR